MDAKRLTFAELDKLRHPDDRGKSLAVLVPRCPPPPPAYPPEVQARAEALAAEWGEPLSATFLDASRLLVEAESRAADEESSLLRALCEPITEQPESAQLAKDVRPFPRLAQ